MTKTPGKFVCLIAVLTAGLAVNIGQAQNNLPEHPVVTVDGRSYTPRSVLSRNRGADEEDQVSAIAASQDCG